MKKVRDYVATIINVNEKLVNQLIKTEQQCWVNSHYTRRECLEVVRIPTPILIDLLEANVFKVFDRRRVHV